MTDIVRVLRVIEYTGRREAVEAQLEGSKRDGTYIGRGVIAELGSAGRVATLGTFPEILDGEPKISSEEKTNLVSNSLDSLYDEKYRQSNPSPNTP